MAEAVGVVRPGRKTYRQIPLDDGYWSRLEVRAAANDRVASCEGARIVKDVLDGKYILRPGELD
jgi:plasmid stability protein